MARPKSDGLLYFPFDTDFFYSDKKIKALRARYGCDGLVIYIYLLTEIYRNGYFIWWDEESEENMMADLNLSDGLIKQVIAFLISRSLLNSILVNSDTALTSPGIQKRYQEAVKGLKRDIFVQKELWLLEETKTATCIKFTKKYGKSEKNESKSEKNESKSEKNSTNEMKRNETKEYTPPTPSEAIEQFISAYPIPDKQINRHLLEIAFIDCLMQRQVTEEQLIASAGNYADKLHRLEKDKNTQFIKRPENFLKEMEYLQYIPGVYEPPERKKQGCGGKNKFGNFEQNDYDFEQLEKEGAE